ncbi:MAG: hypothetical protein O3A46_00865 [Candidatus Poribacteria bacterium]|nr:hypothetical protein [Candidatus Poribacteria bacterium]
MNESLKLALGIFAIFASGATFGFVTTACLYYWYNNRLKGD